MESSIAIIGACIAGLSAGCYAQMNGYRSRIYELHTISGESVELSAASGRDVIKYLCKLEDRLFRPEGNHQQVFYLWRPFLRDPRDDMVLELAVAADCDMIVTYNERDFRGVEKFGLRVITPRVFLQEIGELP